MIAHLYNITSDDTVIGEAQIRIIENRTEAEDPEHGWYGNFRYLEQLEMFNIKEVYPALNITWIEIYPEFRKNGHGGNLLKMIENIAMEKHCSFLFCKIDTNDNEDTASENQNFYHRRDWQILSVRGGEILNVPHQGNSWMTAYKDNIKRNRITTSLKLEKQETPDYLDELWECTIPEND
ncbi:MAG: GNAT family N-acetyltransferase [Akkermansiaceae bacterium]